MTTRRSDFWQYWIAVITLLQLAGGTVYIALKAQPLIDPGRAAIENALRVQHQDDTIDALKARVSLFEGLNVGARLAVLEDVKVRQEKLEFLAYGQILSIGGVLILGLLQLKQRQRSRREP